VTLAVLVTGAGGQLGHDLLQVLRPARDVLFAKGLTRAELDVTDPFDVSDTVAEWVREVRKDGDHRIVVVNAAAYTAVDAAEDDEEAAYLGNATAPALLAAACLKADVPLVHVSTDYVFPGDADRPYEVGDPTGPRSAYGRTKLAGEEAVRELLPHSGYVVRTAWVYGEQGTNFVRTMARLERDRETLTVVDDQRGSPTWSRHLAQGITELARSGAPGGVYHCTNAGETTWCGFARAIFEELGADPARVQPCSTADFPRPAPRPAYSVLSNDSWRAAGLAPLPHWRDALAEAFVTAGDALRG
jgi:dTDP-4-dehydrorhamnose reductase